MSGVDACGRFWSWEAVGPLQMGKTIVMIAYQFSSAKRPNQTLALEGGEIMEWGPMANALTRGGAIPNYCNGRAGREPPSMAWSRWSHNRFG